jgi:pyruvate dehydrogenase E2 component (dihydrolipoamide acetyltransferase)
VTISPRARRVAREMGVDWAALAGSGSSGRIVERDVRAVAAAAGAAGVVTAASGGAVPVGGIRKVVAARMAASAREVPAVTLTTEADATELVALRERVRADRAGTALAVPSYNDMLVRILAVALGEHPELNASWTEAGIVRHPTVNVGVAVETERGLLVPVVRDAGSKSLTAVAAEAAALVERARAGQASADDLSGGTITLTNLGRYEIDAFTPIVNPPEAAILGVGRIVARPVVVDEATERVAVRKMVALSLTFDHRVVDGAPAARFLQAVKHLVEHPHRWALG